MRERVAVVTTSYPERPGDPSGHFVETEVRELEAAGADVEVFALRGDAFGWPGALARLQANPWRIANAAGQMLRAHRAIAHLGSFSRVIAHWAVPSAWPIATSLAVDTKLEVVSHGSDVRLLARLPAPARRFIVGSILHHARMWRFASDALRVALAASLDPTSRARLERIARIQAPRLDVSVHPRAVARAKAHQRALANGARTFVAAARLVPSKRVDRAIDIALREEATLIVIGDGPERARLEQLARERRAHAYFLGNLARPETLAHIAAADALVHTSEAEGLSSVVREAEYLGTRVLTF